MNTKTNLCLLFFMLCVSSFAQVGTYQITATAPSPSTFTDLSAALIGLGSTNPATLHINKSITLTGSLTVPKNVSLKFYNGAVLTVNTGVTLTINGPIDAGLFQIFKCLGTGKVTGLPIIDYAVPQWWQTQSTGPTDWTAAIQNAVDFYPRVYLPRSLGPNDTTYANVYYISQTINLSMLTNHSIFGDGGYSSLINSTATGPVFKMHNTLGNPNEKLNAVFENLMLQCTNGIQINQDPGTLPSEALSMLNVKVNNCYFYKIGSATPSVAINFYQTFDSVVTENFITGFDIGVLLVASDLNTVSNNRIVNFKKFAIEDLSRVDIALGLQFGSQNLILHNDILDYKGTAGQGAFIKSNSLHVIIRDNFLENNGNPPIQPLAMIDCSNVGLTNLNVPLILDITGNRINPGGLYTYLINQDFKSLNMIEGPVAIDVSTFPKSSFCVNSNTLTATRNIPIQWSGRPRSINISNVYSFREWSSFRTTNLMQNAFDGSIVFNPENISELTWHSNTANFNPRAFTLIHGTENFTAFQISQKLSNETGDRNSLPKRLAIKFVTRNLPTPTTGTNDFFVVIKKAKDGSVIEWQGRGTYLSNNTSSTTYNNYNIYEVLPDMDFDSNSDYWMIVDVSKTSNADAEIRSIILEPVITNPVAKGSNKIKMQDPKTEDSRTEDLHQIVIDNDVKTYPNPVKNILTIEVKKGDVLKTVELYDQTGKFIRDYSQTISDNTIDIGDLPNGTYIVKTVSIAHDSDIILKK